MKKIFALLLVILVTFTFVACNKSKEDYSYYEEEIIGTIKPGTDNADDTNSVNENTDTVSNTNENNGTSANKQTTTTSSSQGSNNTDANHTHSYSAATCTAPATCSCGATTGKKAEHTWQDATCTTPKTCTVCKTTKGSASAHKYKNGKCTVCGQNKPVDINTLMSGGVFVGNLQNGNKAYGISFSDRSADGLQNGFRTFLYSYDLVDDESIKHTETININNKKYFVTNSTQEEQSIEIQGTEVHVTNKDTDAVLLKLSYFDNQLTIIESTLPNYPVNTVFTAK